MKWSRMESVANAHSKLKRAGLLGRDVFWSAVQYASRYETDGHIPRHEVPDLVRLHDDPLLGRLKRVDPFAVAEHLVGVGLFEKVGDDYRVHDFLDYNPSRAEAEAERAETRERVSRFRKGRSNGVTNGVSNEGRNGVGNVTDETRRHETRRKGEDAPFGGVGGDRSPSHDGREEEAGGGEGSASTHAPRVAAERSERSERTKTGSEESDPPPPPPSPRSPESGRNGRPGSGRQKATRDPASDPRFIRLWHAYPKPKPDDPRELARVKDYAARVFARIGSDPEPYSRIMADVKSGRLQADVDDDRYIPELYSYLLGRRWEDEDETP